MLPGDVRSPAQLIDPAEPASGSFPRSPSVRSAVAPANAANALRPTRRPVTSTVDWLAGTGTWVSCRSRSIRRPQWTRRVVVFAPPKQRWSTWPGVGGAGRTGGSAPAHRSQIARLRADERERYFRTLVLTSTDVILISRNGRIDYTTPSGWAMFRATTCAAETFDDVVEHDPAAGERHPAPGQDHGHGSRAPARPDRRPDRQRGGTTTLRDVTARRSYATAWPTGPRTTPSPDWRTRTCLRAQLRDDRELSGRYGSGSQTERRAVHRSGRLQGGQRHLRSRDRRPGLLVAVSTASSRVCVTTTWRRGWAGTVRGPVAGRVR